MFNKCKDIIEIKFKNVNMENVNNMSGMFNECSNLNNLNFKTQILVEISEIFNLFLN